MNEKQIESVAYAFYLRSVGGSAAQGNRFGREYGVVFRGGRPMGGVRLKRPG